MAFEGEKATGDLRSVIIVLSKHLKENLTDVYKELATVCSDLASLSRCGKSLQTVNDLPKSVDMPLLLQGLKGEPPELTTATTMATVRAALSASPSLL